MNDELEAGQRALDELFATSESARSQNAHGKLTSRQRSRVLSGAVVRLLGVVGLLVMGAIAAAKALLPEAGLILFVVILGLPQLAARVRDAVRGVRTMDGRIERARFGRRVRVGDVECLLPPGALRLDLESVRWRVYYLPGSREIVGLEPAPSTELGPFR